MRRKRSIFAAHARAAACLCALVLGASACADPPPPRATGPARRVVSLAPNTTEALFAIGAGDTVVGVSRYCDYPEAATRLPKVGGFEDPSLEAVLALSPDLVVGARAPSNRGVADRITQAGIPTWFPESRSVDDVVALLLGLGDRTGHRAEAERVVAQLQARLAFVRAAVDDEPRPRALLLFGHAPFSAAGPGGFADAMLSAAGAKNVLDRGPDYPTLSLERVLDLAPDVIVEVVHDDAPPFDWSPYPTLPAVQHGRAVATHDERLLRPGPRLGDAAAELARLIHPDVSVP